MNTLMTKFPKFRVQLAAKTPKSQYPAVNLSYTSEVISDAIKNKSRVTDKSVSLTNPIWFKEGSL